jgi:Glycosyl transferase family 90
MSTTTNISSTWMSTSSFQVTPIVVPQNDNDDFDQEHEPFLIRTKNGSSGHHHQSPTASTNTTTTPIAAAAAAIRSRKCHSDLKPSRSSYSSSSSSSSADCCGSTMPSNSSNSSSSNHHPPSKSATSRRFENSSGSSSRWYLKYSYTLLLFLLLVILLQCIHIMLPYSSTLCSNVVGPTYSTQNPSSSSSSSFTTTIRHSVFCPVLQTVFNLDASTAHQPPLRRSFPKWGRSSDVEQSQGIAFRPLRRFITSQWWPSAVEMPMTLLDHTQESKTQLYNLPEVLYVVQPTKTTTTTNVQPPQLFMSQKHRLLHMGEKGMAVVSKLNHTERIMIYAIEKVLHTEMVHLLSSSSSSFATKQVRKNSDDDDGVCQYSTWPSLCATLYPSAVRGGQNSQATGFPFLAWFGDYTGCNYHDWMEEEEEEENEDNTNNAHAQPVSIPSFTVAADLNCNHTIPFPNYYHIKSCMKDSTQWDRVMDMYRTIYPFDTKIRQVVWRGSLTGKIFNNRTKCPRWNMVETVRHIEVERRKNHDSAPSLFDIKITKLSNKVQQYHDSLLNDIGPEHYGGDEINFLDFQKYRSILDIDGHSWSGRFGSLLCFNSIVLKVDPQYVDYFYAKREPSYGPQYRKENIPRPQYEYHPLQAWEHYIPIRDDFSNLEEMAEYVLDRKNDEVVQRIIQNANDWCRANMIEDVVAFDMLTIWDRYVQLLNIHDVHWSRDYMDTILRPNTNSSVTSSILRDGGALQMMSLQASDYAPYENNAIVPKQSNMKI